MSQMFGGGGSPFGDIFGRRQQPPRNRTLNIQTQVTLEEAFSGKEMVANLTLPNGRDQILNIKIPKGIQDGVTLRLANVGDDNVPNAPRGDIHLTVGVQPHPVFARQGDDLIRSLEVSAIDAMLGKSYQIETIDGRLLEIKVPEGTQPGRILNAGMYGMPNMNDNRFVGRMLVKLDIRIPADLTEWQKQKLREIFY